MQLQPDHGSLYMYAFDDDVDSDAMQQPDMRQQRARCTDISNAYHGITLLLGGLLICYHCRQQNCKALPMNTYYMPMNIQICGHMQSLQSQDSSWTGCASNAAAPVMHNTLQLMTSSVFDSVLGAHNLCPFPHLA